MEILDGWSQESRNTVSAQEHLYLTSILPASTIKVRREIWDVDNDKKEASGMSNEGSNLLNQ